MFTVKSVVLKWECPPVQNTTKGSNLDVSTCAAPLLDFEVGKGVRAPPPPPAHQLFLDLRDFRGWRRTNSKILCTPLLGTLNPQ